MTLPLSAGYRMISKRGFFQNLTTTIHIKRAGTYYWSVQAIDTAFSGSPFSDEYSFNVTDTAPIPGNNGLISTSNGRPYTSAVILKWDIAFDSMSLTNTLEYKIYSATVSFGDNIVAWEEGSTAISDWLINTNTYTYSISDTDESTDTYFMVIVRDESGNKAMYEPFHTNLFSERLDICLSGLASSAVAFGDYDNDGDLDLLMTGINFYDFAQLYRNTGGFFSKDTNISLPGIQNSFVAFGDYDNDDDLDFIITGKNYNGKITRVYQNTENSFNTDFHL